MNKTSIEWTDYTWNPVTGCHKVSPGCKNCYAETMTNRFGKTWGVESFREVVCHPDRLMEPCYIRGKLYGKKVFVCDMSDLFHEDVPVSFIADVFETIWNCPDTVFQILTKRPERALQVMDEISDATLNLLPLNNVWIGVSCEDQATADQRIPLLLQIPAALHFLSCEPLLGPIDLFAPLALFQKQSIDFNPDLSKRICEGKVKVSDLIHWVICGGESGYRARPMHPDWARSLRDQCAAAEVPFFFKQWGEWLPFEPSSPPFWRCAANGQEWDGHGMNMIDPETGEAGKWRGYRWYDPMDAVTLAIETKSGDCDFLKFGKKASGNLLDGKQHLEFPTTKS